jgi:capsular polysaccharide biosynthesis protein
VDLRRQIAIVRAWLPLLVASVVLAAGVAFVVSSQLPKAYEAKATLLVGQSLSAVNPGLSQIQVSQNLSPTYATVATTRPILDAVVTKLGLGVTSDELRGQVRADAPSGSTLLFIVAQDADPVRAAAIANALAEQLIAASPAVQGPQAEFEASIDGELKATQGQITATQAQADALSALLNPTAQPSIDAGHPPLVLGKPGIQPSHGHRAGRCADCVDLASTAPEHAPRGRPRLADRRGRSFHFRVLQRFD